MNTKPPALGETPPLLNIATGSQFQNRRVFTYTMIRHKILLLKAQKVWKRVLHQVYQLIYTAMGTPMLVLICFGYIIITMHVMP